MGGSFKIARVAGIDVYVHWTFSLLLIWVAWQHWMPRQSSEDVLFGLLFILALFGCVVLHEFGHALAARQFGIGTHDITLLPIGGVARLERMPKDPWQELIVALAGPAVNVAIVAILLPMTDFLADLAAQKPISPMAMPFLERLMAVNVFLVVFNMLPVFPMDGGRVLRAFLGFFLEHSVATSIAAAVGQTLAIFMGLLGLFGGNLILVLIAVFVYFGAQAESNLSRVQSLIGNAPVREAMMTRFRALERNDPLARAIEELLAGAQQDFPVMDGDRVVGMIERSDLFEALAAGRGGITAGELAKDRSETVNEMDRLDKVFELMQANGLKALPVLRDGRMVGLITLENVSEWMRLRSLFGQRAFTMTPRSR